MKNWLITSSIVMLVVIVSKPVFAQEIEVLHMWRTSEEQYALSSIKDPVEEMGIKWSDYWVEGNFKGVQNEFARRISIGDPVGAVQWIISDDTEKLVIQNITRKLEGTNGRFKKLYHPDVYDLVEFDGGISALPVGIHTQNHIVYNRKLLERFNLEPAKSWEELLTYGPILKEANIDLIATSDESWQVRNFGISILSSILEREEFISFQTKGDSITGLKDKLHESLAIMAELRKYSNVDSRGLNWEIASKKVADGEAMVQVLGDYIIPQFPNRDEIYCSATPQSKYVLWGMDTFVFPKIDDPKIIAGQDAFIEATISEDAIKNYVTRKGGIPVTSNILPEELDQCVGNILRDWNEADSKLWMGGQSWRQRLEVLGVFLSLMWKEGFGDIDESTDALIKLLHSVD